MLLYKQQEMAYVRMQCREGRAFCIYTGCLKVCNSQYWEYVTNSQFWSTSENGIDLGKKADSGVYGLVN